VTPTAATAVAGNTNQDQTDNSAIAAEEEDEDYNPASTTASGTKLTKYKHLLKLSPVT
jgi:hypothetical protein